MASTDLRCRILTGYSLQHDDETRQRCRKANAYVRTKLEVTNTADNVLIVRVIEMAVDDLLRERERTLQPGVELKTERDWFR